MCQRIVRMRSVVLSVDCLNRNHHELEQSRQDLWIDLLALHPCRPHHYSIVLGGPVRGGMKVASVGWG